MSFYTATIILTSDLLVLALVDDNFKLYYAVFPKQP